MTKGIKAEDGPVASAAYDIPLGWRGPTLQGHLSALPAIRQVEDLVEHHADRVARLVDRIESGSNRPGARTTHEISIVVDEDGLREVVDALIARLPDRVIESLAESVPQEPEVEDCLLSAAIALVDKCFGAIASSRVSSANVISRISETYRCQDDLLEGLHDLRVIDGIACASYSNKLKYDFNATKLRLAQLWLEHGRDEVDIGKATAKLYRNVLGASRVATEIATIVEAAREWGRLGKHPITGDPVFVKVGPNGRMFVQLRRRSDETKERSLRIELPDRVEYGSSDVGVVVLATSSRSGDPSKVTFQQAISLIDDKLESQRPWRVHPDCGRPIYLRSGRHGPYLQLGRTIPSGGSGNVVRVGVPQHIDPDNMSADEAGRLLSRRMVQDRPIGQDPETGLSVYVKDGRYGPFVQLGEWRRNGPRVKIVNLPEGLDSDDLDLQRALGLLAQVTLRNLGPHPDFGADVTVQVEGQYGPFVSCRGEHATVPERFDPLDVTLEDAVRFLAAKRELMEWRRDTRIEFDRAVRPPSFYYERLGGVREEGLGRSRLNSREYYMGLPEPKMESILDGVEQVRIRQLRVPIEAHRRGDIGDGRLELERQFLEEQVQEARRKIMDAESSHDHDRAWRTTT